MTDKKIMRLLRRTLEGDDGLYVLETRMAEAMRLTRGKIRYSALYERLTEGILKEGKPAEAVYALLQGDDYPYSAVLCVPAYLTLAAVRLYAEGPDASSGRESGRLFGFLRGVGELDPERLYEAASGAERRLLSDRAFADSDRETKIWCRFRVEKEAGKRRMTESKAAAVLLEENRLFSGTHPFAGRLYFALLFALPLAGCIALLYAGFPALPLILCYLPLVELVKRTLDSVYSRCLRAEPLPRLKQTALPEDAAVLTVITALLTEHAELKQRLERIYLANRETPGLFGILGDLPEADEPEKAEDAERIRTLSAAIEELNEKWGEHFCLFIRRRTENAEGSFNGYERKRGALLNLMALIRRGEDGPFLTVLGDRKHLARMRYVVTLDEDTVPGIGTLSRMLCVMCHPANRPRIRDGAVREGFGVLQPVTETSLASAGDTLFSALMTGGGGNDVYASAFYELYQTVFGTGIFCGKGMVDAAVYDALLQDAFPEQTVLSHDLLEGARLRCGLLTDVAVTDGCPGSVLSYLDRQNRWMRGDVQALAFSFRHVRNRRGERLPNPAPALSRLQLWDNLRRLLTPVSAVLALFAAGTEGGGYVLWLLALAYLLYPLLFSLVKTPLHAGRIFHAGLVPPAVSALKMFLYSTGSLLYDAVNALDALFRSLYRMHVSHRRLLAWTTASESEKRAGGFLRYLIRLWPSALFGGLFLVLCGGNPLYAATGLLWLIFPLTAFLLGKKNVRKKERLSRTEQSRLSRYVYDLWRFYVSSVKPSEHGLPPDNMQLSPVEATAHRTSPTNIGMYLVSCLAVRDFGHITGRELYLRAEETIRTVEGLPRWHGHLYNWYDTQTLRVLGTPYVSTVDSGNFAASLVVLKEGLREYVREEPRLSVLIFRIEALLRETDFSVLYDRKRELLRIGAAPQAERQEENCYDLYESEARIASYYGIASGQLPRRHWRMLSRLLIGIHGRIGLASWSGTMFEAFMPALFLPVYPGSLQYEALCLTVREQKRAACRGIWGKSESAYFAFDAGMLYQYRAFGVQKLGLRRNLDRDRVYAPYASFLTLAFAPGSSLANLNRMKHSGLYGRFGFYEAVDFTPERTGAGSAVIRSYMAHHVGMSIAAAANACFSDVMVRRFFADPQMACASELLSERTPTGSPVMNPEKAREKLRRRQQLTLSARGTDEKQTDGYRVGMLSDGFCRVILSSEGEAALYAGAAAIGADPFRAEGLHGLHVLAEADGTVYELCSAGSTMESGMADGSIRYVLRMREVTLTASFTLMPEHACFAVRVTAEGVKSSFVPLLVFEPVLALPREHAAHPAFSDLSLEAEYLPGERILLYRRRGRTEKDAERFLAVGTDGSGPEELQFETRRDGLGLLYGREELKMLSKRRLAGETGACVNPFCAVKKSCALRQGRGSLTFLLAFAEGRESAVGAVSGLRSRRQRTDAFRLCEEKLRPVMQNRLSASGLRAEQFPALSILLACRFRDGNPHMRPSGFFRRDMLWRFGISGDDPIFCLRVREGLSEESRAWGLLEGFVRAHRLMGMVGLRSELVLLYRGGEDYFDAEKQKLLALIRVCGSEPLLSAHGGVYPVPADAGEGLLPALSVLYAEIGPEASYEGIRAGCDFYRETASAVRRPAQAPLAAEPVRQEVRLRVRGGFFTDDGFTVEKPVPQAPWSFPYANRAFGTLVTQNSLGYTWAGNAQTRRLTPWDADKLSDMSGEQLLYTAGEDGTVYDLCACAGRVSFGMGCAEYRGCAGGVSYAVRVGVDEKLPVKLVTLRFLTGAEDFDAGCVQYRLRAVMGGTEKTVVVRSGEDGTLLFRSCFGDFTDWEGFLAERREPDGSRLFLLGASPVFAEDRVRREVLARYRTVRDAEDAFARNSARLCGIFSVFEAQTGDAATDLMINRMLPYQTAVCRIFARTGFYQSGGAYGFRDQLQDAAAILPYLPGMTRTQIFRAAAHQFEEGDVQHWWHPGDGVGRGVRTRCSDDFLWLPELAARYAEYTGDMGIFEVPLPYLTSPVLSPGETERYELPKRSSLRESLWQHCIRALEHGLRFGAHGLPLIGTGDWNDGMNAVGREGNGESVWLAFFLWTVLGRFIPLCEKRGDADGAARYRRVQGELRNAWERAFDGAWYLRGYYDGGEPLGGSRGPEARIFLLPQAFSAFCGAAHAGEAVKTAFDRLYDGEWQILRLFAPPFGADAVKTGYLRGYCGGLRENGGQYTHGAVWGLRALLLSGMYEEGNVLRRALNPALRCTEERLAARYRIEPYCMAGDVYGAPGHAGRGGWSLYTGAAGWYLRVLCEDWLGFRREGDHFSVYPHGCGDCAYTVRICGTEYRVEIRQGKDDRCVLDGKPSANCFPLDKKKHLLQISVDLSGKV